MIHDFFDVMPLKPVRYQIANVSVLSKANKRPAAFKKRESNITVKSDKLFNLLIRCCVIAFMLMAIFTAINIIGFSEFMNNVKQVVENQSVNKFFTNPEFV